MRPLTIAAVSLFIIIEPVTISAMSESQAKDILGDHFISTNEATCAWGKENKTEYDIQYTTKPL